MSSTATVELVIHKGMDLVALNPGGTSNPYVTATIGAQSVSTPVQNKTVNPLYECTFTFVDCPLPTILTLRVLNKLPYVDLEDLMGVATLTLFEPCDSQTKTVPLTHGGNASLAQRAPQGCGTLQIAYRVSATTTPPPPPPEPQVASTTAVSTLRPVTQEVLRSPGAHNIEGSPALPTPVPVQPAQSNTFVATNPAVCPAPPVVATPQPPGEQAGSAPVPTLPPPQLLTPPSLMPPSIAPAQVPPQMRFPVADSAPLPPTATPAPTPMNTTGVPGFVSYAIPGLAPRTPPAAETAAATASATAPRPAATAGESDDLYYANNDAAASSLPARHSVATAPATSAGPPQNVVVALPVAPPTPPANRLTPSNKHEPAALAASLPTHSLSRPATPSTLFDSAAHAPAVRPAPVLATPPMRSTAQPGARPRDPQRPPPLLQPQGALVSSSTMSGAAVAVAPVPQPLSSSTTTSRRTTPRTLPSSMPQEKRRVSEFTGQAPSLLSSSSLRAQRDSYAHKMGLSDTTGEESKENAMRGEEPWQRRRTRPVTASLAAPTTHAAGAARLTDYAAAAPTSSVAMRADAKSTDEAAMLYADRVYLHEAAASGADLAIFRRLRAVDPTLCNGFAQCVDYAGCSLLHTAAWHGQLAVMQILLAAAPEPPLLDLRTLISPTSGNTILHAAACGGQQEVAVWLRYTHPTAGPLLLNVRNLRGMTAAECAKEAGFDQVARLLMPG